MIPDSVRRAYDQQVPLAELLITEIERLVTTLPKPWFITARKKELESFAQKVESGRVADPEHLEDFVGAMIVVPMAADLPEAISKVEKFFEVEYQRPRSPDATTKLASDFPFDDLRLYGRLRARDDLPPRPIDNVLLARKLDLFDRV